VCVSVVLKVCLLVLQAGWGVGWVGGRVGGVGGGAGSDVVLHGERWDCSGGFADDAGGDAHDGGGRWDVFEHERAGSDLGHVADFDVAEKSCSGAYENAIADSRVALAVTLDDVVGEFVREWFGSSREGLPVHCLPR